MLLLLIRSGTVILVGNGWMGDLLENSIKLSLLQRI